MSASAEVGYWYKSMHSVSFIWFGMKFVTEHQETESGRGPFKLLVQKMQAIKERKGIVARTGKKCL